jgi:iron complex outermembrane recepter protein
MKFSIVIIALIAVVHSSYSQSFKGKLIDELTSEPVIGATIELKHNGRKTGTDHSGFFSIESDFNENDSIVFSCTGYENFSVKYSTETKVYVMKYSLKQLQPTTITANRKQDSRENSPIAISKLTPKQIDETKATSVFEIINKTPGVNMVNLGNEQHMMSIRQPMNTNSYFLYLEDGIPIRPLGVFNHNALLEINQFTINSIEVVKGPVSSIYGAEAIGGAVNFISQKPTAIPSAKVGFQFDQFGYKRLQFGAGGKIKKFGIYVGGITSQQTNSWMTFSDYEKSSINVRMDYEFSEKTRLIGSVVYSDYYSDMSGSVDSIAFYNRTYKSTTDFTYRKSKAMRSRLTFEHDWKNGSSSSITAFQRKNELGQNPSYAISWKSKKTVASGQINSSNFESYGVVAQHVQKIKFLSSELIVGATYDYSPTDYWAYKLDLFADLRPDSLSVEQYRIDKERPDIKLSDYNAIIQNYGAYGQYTLSPMKNLKISFGGRFDLMSFTYNNLLANTSGDKAYQKFTPKVGATYKIKTNSGVYLNYAQGFAPPGLTSIFRPKPNTNPVEFYYNLEAATFDNYEVGGWISLFKQKLLMDVSIYQMNGKNELLNIKQPDNSTDYQSAGKTLHQGVEFGLSFKPTSEYTFRFGGTYAIHKFIDFKVSDKVTDAIRDYNGKFMPSAPNAIWNTEFSYYPKYVKNLRASVEWQFVSSYYQNQINTLKYDGYNLINFRIGYKWRGIELYTNVMNLTNVLYATNATRGNFITNTSTFTAAAPRTFVMGVQYNFSGKK